MVTTKDVINAICQKNMRGAWYRGVQQYAVDIAENIGEVVNDWSLYSWRELETIALNGATDWGEFSAGGCSLIFDSDICERLCPQSEVKRKRHGELEPNAYETWLDVQARALVQAWDYIEFIGHYYLHMPIC